MAQFLDNWRDRWSDVVDWWYYMSGPRKAAAVAVAVALLAGIGFWQLRPDSESEESGFAPEMSASDGGADGDSSVDQVATTDEGLERVSDADSPSSTAGGSTVPPTDGSGATAASAPTSVLAESAGPVAVVPSTPDAGGSPVARETPLDYPSSPDGAPLPLVVVFDTETITISGQVPANEQGELQGSLTSLISATGVVGPLLMTYLFAFFTSPAAPVQFPGAPFLLGAVLTLGSVALAAYSLKKYPPAAAGAVPAEAVPAD